MLGITITNDSYTENRLAIIRANDSLLKLSLKLKIVNDIYRQNGLAIVLFRAKHGLTINS